MQEALCFSSQPRPPHSGSRHPKSGAFPGSVHIQEEPSEAGEILVTSDYSLPPAIHLPSLPQRRQGDRAMAEQAGQGTGLGFQGGRIRYSRRSPRKEWVWRWGSGGGPGLASARSHLAQCSTPGTQGRTEPFPRDHSISLGPPFPEAGLSLPNLRETFSKTHAITLQLALVLGSWERLP